MDSAVCRFGSCHRSLSPSNGVGGSESERSFVWRAKDLGAAISAGMDDDYILMETLLTFLDRGLAKADGGGDECGDGFVCIK